MNTKKKFLTAALSALLISLPAAAFAADAEPEMKYDHGVVSIENNAQSKGGNVLIGAQYDDEGRMVKVRLYDVTGKERVSVGSDFAPNSSVKFMLWDDLSEMESAAKAEETRTEPAPSVLKDGESYGWVISVYDNEAGKTVVKLMTANGAKDYIVADDISVWLPGNAETGLQNYEGNSKGEPVSIETAADAIKEINNYETETDASGKETVINPTDYLVSLDYRGSGYEIRLVKYATNDNGELSKLYYAVDAAEIEDNDALRVDINNLSGLPPVCGTVQGYLISDGITEFNVPNNYEAMSDPYNYSVGSVDSSNYVISETGSARNYLVGGFINAAQPTFVINFMNINDDPAQFTEMDSAGAGPDMMIADNTKALGLDRQGNPVYKINGYLNDAKASVETNKNTSIGQMTTSFWSQMNNGRNFDAQTVWTTADNGGDNPDTIISKGDTLLYMPSGRVIAKYIDASSLYDYVVNGTEMDPDPIGEHSNISSSRVGFWFGTVSENGRTEESTWIKLDDISETFFVPDDKVINLVEIDKNTGEISIVSDGTRSDKLLPFDKETNTGDYMYISSANKGGLKDVTVYRFTDGTRQPENLENPKPLSKLGEGESYGWVISVYDSDDGENTMIKLMTADGAVDYPVSESADIWLPGQSEPGYTGGIGAALKSVEYTKVMNSIYDSSGTEVRLVKYGTNSSGEISKLYYAINSSLTDDENAVTVHTINLRGTPARMGAVGGYMVTDGIIEFNVPNDTAHMEDTANYSVKQVKASEYVVPENGTVKSFAVAETVNGFDATLVINFTQSSADAASFTEMDSAGAGPSAMVVDSIETNADGVYTIVGHIDGIEQSVRTNRNTNIGWLVNNFWTSSNNGRSFDAYSLWTAAYGYDKWVSDPEAPETGEIVSSDVPIGDIADIIDKGDLILYSGDGKLIAKYIDASVMADYFANGEDATSFPTIVDSQPTNRDPLATRTLVFNPLGQHTNNSSARVGYFFCKLTGVIEANGTEILELDGASIKIPVSNDKFIDLVTVSGGKVNYDTDGLAANELKSGDYVYVSTANKGMLNNVVVYRFTD